MVDNVFLSLGSNKGDRLKYISEAVHLISESKNCEAVKCSSVYETTPYGSIEQENFYNAVIEIRTKLNLDSLYHFVKEIEKKVGRKENYQRWCPREIDIDILFFNNLIYNSDKLTVPHKEILLRDFVIVPLIEIAGDFVHPVLHQKLNELDLSKIEKHIKQKLSHSLK